MPAPSAPTLKGQAFSKVNVLSWETVAGATSYVLERRDAPQLPWRTLLDDGSVNRLDVGMENGRTYEYRLSAKNLSGLTAALRTVQLCFPPFGNGPPNYVSPFNRVVPVNAQINARSSFIVARFCGIPVGTLGGGKPNTIASNNDYGKPTYYPEDSDPYYTLNIPGSQLSGKVQLPLNAAGERVAEPAGELGGTDKHITVVKDGFEYGLWDAEVDHDLLTISAGAGRRVPLNDALYDDQTRKTKEPSGINAAGVSARFANLAGLLRAAEWREAIKAEQAVPGSGVIRHALFVVANTVAGPSGEPSTSIWPAHKTDGSKDASLDYPRMGTRMRLKRTYDVTRGNQAAAWQRVFLRTIQQYGFIIGDSTGSPWAFNKEHGITFTKYGAPDPFVALGQEFYTSGLDGLTRDGVNGPYYFDIGKGMTKESWNAALEVVDPVGTMGSPPVATG